MTADRRPEDHGGADPDLAAIRAAASDRAAFAILYRRYLDRVYGYAFYLLGDHHDAEDATERTFLAALGAVDRFREEGATVRAWLFRIAHNEIANVLRSRRRRRADSLDRVTEPTDPSDPVDVVTAGEDARRVRDGLAALSEDRRQVLVLRFVDGLSAREIGVVLGRTEGAVRVLQHRALRDLARRLSPSEGSSPEV
jgi:RNA polymerase sigma-70 factor, ECF subfamily